MLRFLTGVNDAAFEVPFRLRQKNTQRKEIWASFQGMLKSIVTRRVRRVERFYSQKTCLCRVIKL